VADALRKLISVLPSVRAASPAGSESALRSTARETTARETTERETTAAEVALPEQSFSALLPSGRLVEIVGAEGLAARTTTALAVIARAQAAGEPAAWVQLEDGGLFPPDVAESGVDLDALIVVHVPIAAGAVGLARAAELLLRSNGFGVVVVDLTAGVPPGDAWPGRLAGLARQHDMRLVVLTDKSARRGSVGPLVAVRVEAVRRRVGAGRWDVEAHVLRNKSGTPLESLPLNRRGPRGAS